MPVTSRSSADLTPGLRNPEKPDHWLVPPWPTNASYCAVVRHFLCRRPWDFGNARIMLAYYRGYQAALAQAPTHELTYPADWAWFEEMRTCVGWCITLYEAAQQAERKDGVGSPQERDVTIQRSVGIRAVPSSVVREAS